ncbi:MAG: hypothetical protein AB7F99_06345 [Vicinamibacterales bacterium]
MDSDKDLPRDKPYEAPRVEETLTPEELAREVQYAGNINSLEADNDG